MPRFVFSHREVLLGVLSALGCCIMLIIQLILMKRNPVNVIFEIIIPFTSAVTFGCYAITMTYNRPKILICPTLVYFVSLLVNQLISVEVGVEDTYPFVAAIELVPFLAFAWSAFTGRQKKYTAVVLWCFCALLSFASVIIVILVLFFRVKIFNTGEYVKHTFGFVCGLLAAVFMYLEMRSLLFVCGTETKRTDESLQSM